MLPRQNASDTIFALSTGQLPSGVAVIRISGNGAFNAIQKLCGVVPEARVARLVTIRDEVGEVVDQGLCLTFPAPRSFTGENCAELQVHGGRAVVNKLLQCLAALPDLRIAEAGEFSKRAYLNGKLNLTEAEALADLIDAETEAQRQFALSNQTMAHERLYDQWREKLLHIRAYMEAELDFADETDVPDDAASWIWNDLEDLHSAIRAHIESYRSAEIIREGFRVALIGAPNAGKSTLLNHLAKREAAIVSEIPGTTRDVIEVQLELDGFKVILTDTAGIREDADEVEAIGIERSLKAAEDAHLILHLIDGSNPRKVREHGDADQIDVYTKADIATPDDGCIAISTHRNIGIQTLLDAMVAACRRSTSSLNSVSPFRLRHVRELEKGAAAINRALNQPRDLLELSAEEMREASDALARICGRSDVEEILGAIFSSFCVGK
ncbi:tRNA uridine-5-carboxymethylaminomethyl(34) synthesis GTPase MnmE [Nitratireductor basaltis]|uniref:tRNA modification GTPase MnmE n=1 Tax=Nitratireductor basaltis TaxID=472175 RepID=A0A084U6D1_9HYPH|nr:tRNA uridine-5-carboxymethylaminomethyl(34) synthesis GTPase MnmE [Nitratireductor basaltis]KFB08517.1 tRNA modification GTPase MnmE [Nitratireductor basaltis]